MEASSVFAKLTHFSQTSGNKHRKPCFSTQHFRHVKVVVPGNYGSSPLRIKKTNPRISAVTEETSLAFTSDPVITWQIVVGSIAGITPFVVAGIEFSKRIIKQKQCEECKGSGLVIRDDQQYIKCPECGGWLPWLSWRQFFTG